jgi:hypothetical protein
MSIGREDDIRRNLDSKVIEGGIAFDEDDDQL